MCSLIPVLYFIKNILYSVRKHNINFNYEFINLFVVL